MGHLQALDASPGGSRPHPATGEDMLAQDLLEDDLQRQILDLQSGTIRQLSDRPREVSAKMGMAERLQPDSEECLTLLGGAKEIVTNHMDIEAQGIMRTYGTFLTAAILTQGHKALLQAAIGIVPVIMMLRGGAR